MVSNTYLNNTGILWMSILIGLYNFFSFVPGILHYAGPVVYQVKRFLEKNKDVQQDMFFDFLENSSSPFSREIAKYRV